MTKQQVLKRIGEDRWDEFMEWMKGQTVGMGEDGEADFYQEDVERFEQGKSSFRF